MIKYFSVILFLFFIRTFAANPYFISVECNSTKIVISQKIGLSFTTNPAKLDTIRDSSFSCTADSCSWLYTIERIDTLKKENTTFGFSTVDSFYYVDTLDYSFFDAENDSCKFIIAGLDSAGNRVFADSTWGNTASRPGSNRVIYFTHKKPFQSIFPGIVQLSKISDTIFDTIQNNSTSVYNTITDSSFYANLNGAWRKIFQQDCYFTGSNTTCTGSFVVSSGGYFFDSNKVIEYNENKSSIYNTVLDSDSYIRDGWNLKKENISMYEHLTQVIIDNDTLITCAYSQGGISRHTYTYVYVRDTSIQLNELPVKRHIQQNTDNFKLNISSNKMASIISFNLPQRQKVGLVIFDLAGRMVMKSLDQILEAGEHQIHFAPGSVTGNAYICRINVAGNVLARRFTLLK
jgi:hypothetical protein